jgi:UDP-4-amino-4,6-dideoxy-N-acetyl-beta-L-altrosamine N-acetyltransferase
MDVLAIRNSDAVRKSMYNEHQITAGEHHAWIDRLGADARQKVFVVLKEGKTAVGVVSVNQLDYAHRKTDWAFYLAESERGGLGAALEIFMIEYVFEALGFWKLNCEVLETNPRVVEMHKRFGFAEEGFRASNIEKDGKRIGVHFLGLSKDSWSAQKEKIIEEVKSKVHNISLTLDSGEVA